MRVLLTGITGGIGRELAPRLNTDGHQLRALSRRPAAELSEQLRQLSVELIQGDVITGAGLARALDGIDVAYYLIHSMEPSGEAQAFPERELQAAEHFATAASAAGVSRVIYLGGLIPPRGTQASPHLTSRLAVERTLLEAIPGSVALRAPIVIGPHSRSFRLLVRLLERLPLVPVPSWGQRRTTPVDARDVIECLARAAAPQAGAGLAPGSYDLGGPEVVSYMELLARIRDALLLNRPLVSVPLSTQPTLAGHLSALITGEQPTLIAPLMASLETDLLPWQANPLTALSVRPHRLNAAIERALRQWEALEPLSAW